MKMKKETLQRLLGSRYKFEQYLNAEEVEVLKRQAPEDFFEREAAALTAGYVKISAVLFRLNGTGWTRRSGFATTTQRMK